MEGSASYIAIEAMLRQGWFSMSFTELEHFLDLFEKKHIITPSEHSALLDLARKLTTDPSHTRGISSGRE